MPSSTIVVTERECFSTTITALEALIAHTPEPRRIVVVDSGAPRSTSRRLQSFAAAYDMTLLRSRKLLNANEERNIALRHVATEYVAFVENDSIVPKGWLQGLERCARETDADVVIPVITWGLPANMSIHYAGGATHITEDGGVRRLEERDHLLGHDLDELTTLERTPSTNLEPHCALARADTLRRIGPLDESLMSARDHIDLGLRLTAAGASMWMEPGVAVHYLWPKRLATSDYPYFFARWSDEWGERSFASFNETWRIDDTSIDQGFRHGHRVRRLRYVPWPPGWRGRVAQTRHRVRVVVDRVATPVVVRYYDRQRARATTPCVVHAGSWDAFARAQAGIGDSATRSV
jgi:GT2 family glycosyltransferase